MKTWVLVANRSRAKLYLHRDKPAGMTTVEELDHPEGRLKDREIDTDKDGRTDHASGGTNRSAYQRDVEPHEHLAQLFAKKLADRLYHGRVANEYERLLLAAEPHFLGLLKGALDGPTAHLLHGTIARDLTAERPESVGEYVREALLK
jgi:protein required for attachment to host cells